MKILRITYNANKKEDFAIRVPKGDVGEIVGKLKPIVNLTNAHREYLRSGAGLKPYPDIDSKAPIAVKISRINERESSFLFEYVNNDSQEIISKIERIIGLHL